MDPKQRGTTRAAAAVVTEGAAQAVLRRGPARELAAEEEKVMRMRLGAALPRTAALEWSSDELTEDLQIELQAMQVEAWMKWKAHLASRRAPARPTTSTTAAPRTSRTKEKIVRALRKKS
jgi:hypothetical protein